MIKNNKHKIIHGGYSDIRLWPCYMIFSIVMFYLIPTYGAFNSMFWMTILVIIIANQVARRQTKEIYDVKAWSRDYDIAIKSGLVIPNIHEYLLKEKIEPKVKVEKVKRQKLTRVLTATARS